MAARKRKRRPTTSHTLNVAAPPETERWPAPDRPTLGIVTPWHDHLELADDYFNAVDAANPDQLVVVDDGSDPPLWFAAARLEQQSGFCAANNHGLKLVETEFVLMLNNDIKAFRHDWLEDIRALMEHGKVLGPFREDEHGDVDGIPYPYIDGWCCAMATEDLRRIGGWDERYDAAGPAYFSDNALSVHARAHGLRLKELIPGLMHKGGQTGGFGPGFQHALNVNGQLFAADVRALPAHQRALATR